MTRTRSPPAFLVPLSLFIFFLLFSTRLHRSSSHSEPCSNVRNWKKNDVFCFLFLFYLVSLVLSFFLFSIHRFYGSLGTASRKLYLFFPLSPSSVFPFPSLTCFTLSYRVFVFYSPSTIPLGFYFSLSPFFSSFLLLFGSIYQLAYPPLLYSFSFIYHRLFWEIFCSSHLYNPIRSCSVVCFVSPFPPPRWAGWPSIGYFFEISFPHSLTSCLVPFLFLASSHSDFPLTSYFTKSVTECHVNVHV